MDGVGVAIQPGAGGAAVAGGLRAAARLPSGAAGDGCRAANWQRIGRIESRADEWNRPRLAAARSEARQLRRQPPAAKARLQAAHLRTACLKSRPETLLRALFVRKSEKPVEPPGKEDTPALPSQPYRLPGGPIIGLDRACDDSHLRPCGSRGRGPHCMISRVAGHRIAAPNSRQHRGCVCTTCEKNGRSSGQTVISRWNRYDRWRLGHRGRS